MFANDERLRILAARENTVIDNPYQSGQINFAWNRNQLSATLPFHPLQLAQTEFNSPGRKSYKS